MSDPRAEPTEPVLPRTMASSLVADLRTDIIEGRLLPGSKLRLRELELRYDAGTIPLREALCRLTASGFVVAEDQKGFRVSQVSRAELEDLTETRIFIECEAFRRSIRRGRLDWEERVVGAHFRVQRLSMTGVAGDALDPDWERSHDDFHAALLSACGSESLLSMAGLLRDRTRRYRHLSVRRAAPGAPGRDVPAEHRALFEAALGRDPTAASAALEAHLRTTTAKVMLQADGEAA